MHNIMYLTEDSFFRKKLDQDYIILKSQYYLAAQEGRNIFFEDRYKKQLLVSMAEMGQPDAMALYYELFNRFENNIIDANVRVMDEIDKKTNILGGRSLFPLAIYEFSCRNIDAFNSDINYIMNLVETLQPKSTQSEMTNKEIKKFFEEYYSALEKMMDKYSFTDTMSLAILVLRANSNLGAIHMSEFLEYIDFITSNFPLGAFSLDAGNLEKINRIRRQYGIEAYKVANNYPEEVNPLFSAGVFLLPFTKIEDEFYRDVPKKCFKKLSTLKFSSYLTEYQPMGVPCVPVERSNHND